MKGHLNKFTPHFHIKINLSAPLGIQLSYGLNFGERDKVMDLHYFENPEMGNRSKAIIIGESQVLFP